ncbi:hypothetical protein [Streptomyces paradoxus]|uniref:Uncharacterized protein n=1 Tax=Streptomyces paradoxus TaxID=66375 RepID=A0A7W9TF13_9ACTN|nr:hypothetical protein [Streptomyces paradoxus]MBB6079500.1 hypothetical protein [Streptomyces paradoxus]
MTNHEEAGAPSISTGFAVGMLIGIPSGFLLGLAVFDNMAMSLVLGGGVGGVQPAAQERQCQVAYAAA